MPANDRDAALRRVYQDARAAGLDEEGARVAMAIATTEAGYGGAQGDADIGGSRGTFQFYFGGGMGNAFAQAHGLTQQQADALLARDPHAGNRWALEGYLGQAIREGQAKGLHGPDLATYAQRYGQRSVSPERSGANYQTVSYEGGEMDRPPSSFEPPSRYGGAPTTGSSSRSTRMTTRVADLQKRRDELRAKVDRLLAAGPDETPAADEFGDITPAEKARADAARANRATMVADARSELSSVETALRQTETDLSNDPDPKDAQPKDPMQAEKDRIAVEAAAFALAEAKRKAGAATSPEEKRLAELEVRKAELGVQQAELTLERTRNPLAPQRAPRYPEEVAAAQQDLEKGALDIAKARQGLLPKQQQILQGHQETVKYVQGMLERGEIDPAQADAYVALSKQAAESALRGFTPFDEMKEKRAAEQASQRMGVDLLNQRLSSGAGLASSLLSGATSLAGHAMLRPGQTGLGVDPLAQLMPILNQLGGGADVAPFAKGLLMGGGQQPPGMPGAMPLPAGL